MITTKNKNKFFSEICFYNTSKWCKKMFSKNILTLIRIMNVFCSNNSIVYYYKYYHVVVSRPGLNNFARYLIEQKK